MKKVIKWLVILFGGLIVVFLLLIVFGPRLLDLKQVKAAVESRASKAIGRSVEMRGDLMLSFFPWAALQTEDVRIKNAPGFQEPDMVSVPFFEARIAFLPLVTSGFKEIQVSRFIVDGARVVLEKNKNGRTNWEDLGKTRVADTKTAEPKKAAPPQEPDERRLPFKSFRVQEFAVRNSTVLWIDPSRKEPIRVSEIQLGVTDFSLERSFPVSFSASVAPGPFSLNGSVGPLGKDLSHAEIPVDVTIQILKKVRIGLKGKVSHVTADMAYDVSVEIPPFSLRSLMKTMGQDFPVKTSDPHTFEKIKFRAEISGDTRQVSLSKGRLAMDDALLKFSGNIQDFLGPHIQCDLDLDRFDLNPYLPPEREKGPEPQGRAKGGSSESAGKKEDKQALRQLVLDGNLRIKELVVDKRSVRDIRMKMNAKNAVFCVDPLELTIYEGDVSTKGCFDLGKKVPESRMNIRIKDMHTQPLVQDFVEKDLFEGKLNGGINLRFEGDTTARIKESLSGDGRLVVEKGALKGVDLAALIRRTKSTRKTPFSEFIIPFSIKNGSIRAKDARMVSTLFRAKATGTADLVSEALNFRIEPTFVTTKREDPEKMKASEVMVPVLVKGTFSEPEFKPDLSGMAKQRLKKELYESEEFEEWFEKEELKPLKEDVKDLLEGIFQ